ncbi:MAG: hypothetical protein WBR26_10605 [Candidatus Acidiferrum sp.]
MSMAAGTLLSCLEILVFILIIGFGILGILAFLQTAQTRDEVKRMKALIAASLERKVAPPMADAELADLVQEAVKEAN